MLCLLGLIGNQHIKSHFNKKLFKYVFLTERETKRERERVVRPVFDALTLFLN